MSETFDYEDLASEDDLAVVGHYEYIYRVLEANMSLEVRGLSVSPLQLGAAKKKVAVLAVATRLKNQCFVTSWMLQSDASAGVDHRDMTTPAFVAEYGKIMRPDDSRFVFENLIKWGLTAV